MCVDFAKRCHHLRRFTDARRRIDDVIIVPADKLAYADLSHLAAASQASTSPLQMRRQSEMSISSSLSLDPREVEEDSSSRGGNSGRGSIGSGFGLGGGRWFAGSSSGMSQNGSSQGY